MSLGVVVLVDDEDTLLRRGFFRDILPSRAINLWWLGYLDDMVVEIKKGG